MTNPTGIRSGYYEQLQASKFLEINILLKFTQEEILSYIRERYGDYLDKLLEEYGYGSQEAGKGPKNKKDKTRS